MTSGWRLIGLATTVTLCADRMCRGAGVATHQVDGLCTSCQASQADQHICGCQSYTQRASSTQSLTCTACCLQTQAGVDPDRGPGPSPACGTPGAPAAVGPGATAAALQQRPPASPTDRPQHSQDIPSGLQRPSRRLAQQGGVPRLAAALTKHLGCKTAPSPAAGGCQHGGPGRRFPP